jgi:CheY-like chemotaxis protein
MTENLIHVLLVEDNPLDARLVKGMLRDDGIGDFSIQHAKSLANALSVLSESGNKQVILLDLGLPDETGLQTLRRIVPLANGASIVVLTGYHDEELGIAAVREGCARLPGQGSCRRATTEKSPSLCRGASETANGASSRNRGPRPSAAGPANFRAAIPSAL